jgi:predicted AAA+ superfamily ATPase
MDILEILYDNPPKSRRFLPRKIMILDKKTILFGPRGSGKSSIIIDHLDNYSQKDMLYIDFSDLRVKSDDIQDLQNFIDKNHIKLVVLEHYDFQCPLPNAPEIILSSTKVLHVEGFKSVFVALLDFEEFAAFDKKHQNIEHTFNLFANIGSYPSVILGQEEAKYRHIQYMLKSFLPTQNSLDILKELASFQSRSLSVFEIYKLMKAKIPLSKDTIYKQIEMLENEFYIYFVPKFDKKRTNKKFYFADFAIKNALSFEKDFLARFENIVFCELIKKERDIFYINTVDFYLPLKNTAILCVPFLPPELIKRRFAKLQKELKELHVTKLQAITIGNEGKYKESGITCEIIPFWEWAMR